MNIICSKTISVIFYSRNTVKNISEKLLIIINPHPKLEKLVTHTESTDLAKNHFKSINFKHCSIKPNWKLITFQKDLVPTTKPLKLALLKMFLLGRLLINDFITECNLVSLFQLFIRKLVRHK